MTTHENGAKRHGADWINANQAAADALIEAGLRPWEPSLKRAIPIVVLRVLDRMRTTRGEEWDKAAGRWKKKDATEIPEMP